MRIRHVEVRNFRGIRRLDWTVGGDYVCLVGPGDSTKTTVLDAIEYALSPRWNLAFDDNDFYQANTDEQIHVTVTVGDLPAHHKSLNRYGRETRGWMPSGELRDEPQQGDEVVLSVRLKVTDDMEPVWRVVNDRNPDGVAISAKDRGRLGCVRFGPYVDRHMSWGKGSALSKLTSESDDLSSILAETGRAARQSLDQVPKSDLPALYTASETAQGAGAEVGVRPQDVFRPSLDLHSVAVTSGSISLHDGVVPVRRLGLGTRRLLAVGIQRHNSDAAELSLVDEIEYGLEPHRLRHLLRLLRKSKSGEGTDHVIVTTHSPVAVSELKAAELRVVRSAGGTTSILDAPQSLQPVVRKASEALLARKIIVCEGDTEIGMCRHLDQYWSKKGPSFASLGVALADGRGSEAAKIARDLKKLGYEVLLLCDSDREIQPTADDLRATGISVVQWEDDCALEARLASDLPWTGVGELVQLAISERGEQSVRDSVSAHLEPKQNLPSGDPADWTSGSIDEAELRRVIGDRAAGDKSNKRKGWFKRVDLGEELGRIVASHCDGMHDKDLGKKLKVVRRWVEADG